MDFLNRSYRRCRRIPTIALLAAGAFSASQAGAETIFTINGVDVDSAVVDLYFQSRLGGQGATATPEQREFLMTELRNIYALATDESSSEFADDPVVAAQIELQKQSIIFQAAAADYFANVEVTDEQLQAEYQSQLALYPPLDFKARHILVETQGEAELVIAELNDGGNFEELAKEKSTGPTGPNGGDLDWFSPTQMVAEFSAAVAELEDGQFTKEPVQTQFGWHVILREDSRESSPPPFDSSVEELRQKVANDLFQAHIESLAKSEE